MTTVFRCFSNQAECRLKNFKSATISEGDSFDPAMGPDSDPELQEEFTSEEEAKAWLDVQEPTAYTTSGSRGKLLNVKDYYYEKTSLDENGDFKDSLGLSFAHFEILLEENK